MINDIVLVILLSIIQGLTEFLPISSSAHLLLPSLLFGTKDLGLSFDIATHAGTLVAVIFYFKNDLMRMSSSLLNNDKSLLDDRRLALLLIIATVPIVIVGLLSSDLIQQRLFSLQSIATMNIVFAFVLMFAFAAGPKNKTIKQLTIFAAIFIGLIQVFALIPGASRSGTAITAGLIAGLSLKDASKFAFLLGIPTILGALVFLLLDMIAPGVEIDLLQLLVGFSISSVVAFLTIKYFLLFVEKIGVMPFVIYRIILGMAIILI
jgi:undecaprenyl-diphosphatase